MRAERELMGWTQADLAKRLAEDGLALHPSAIAKIELREVERPRAIRLDEAEVIARAFGLTVDEMYETADHRVRYLGNRMILWLERVSGEIADGTALSNELQELLASANEAEEARLSHIFSPDELIELVTSASEQFGTLLSRLRHPSLAHDIAWEYAHGRSDGSET